MRRICVVTINKELVKKILIITGTWAIIAFCILGYSFSLVKLGEARANKNRPVENDSLEITNTNLKKEVNSLDSIKYEKINEVKHLNNDSTIKLFYELIRK